MARKQGIALAALARQPQAPAEGVEWMEGRLDDVAALRRLCEGATAVIHVAGAINARDRADFEAANVTGTEGLVAATNAAGVPRFIHVSSLAAREPDLSNYGWSKAGSETAVREGAVNWTIVRPPTVYGPGDRETLTLFRTAAYGVVPLPPTGKLSLIHVDDLCRLLLTLASSETAIGEVIEPDDGRPGGWHHQEFAEAIGQAVGRKVHALRLPRWAIKAGARLDEARGRLHGHLPQLSRDRARYIVHPDWTVSATARPDPALWSPAIDSEAGLAATARWYREKGWLR